MSQGVERTELLGQVRNALAELLAEGVDYVPVQRARRTDPAAPEVGARQGRLELAAPGGGEKLEAIRTDLGDCTRCPLHQKRREIVFGEGNPQADVVFVGEGPGAEEDRTGRPFVGRAGELLDKMIQAIGWQREDVYICNIVKCRPPGNRDPETGEVKMCRPFLDRQLEAIGPRVIVTLGRPAASTLLGRPVAITKQRGIWQEWNGIPLLPTFHPAYLLRNYTLETRRAVWDDLRAVRARVDETL
jgi:DNA polymerase